MAEKLRNINSRLSLLAACALGTAGVKIFSVLPLLLGTIADHLQLNSAQTGLVATYYYMAYFVMTLTAVFWVRRISWRVSSTLGFALLISGLLLSAFFNHSYIGVIGGLMISGLGSAIIYPLSVTLVSDMSAKDRRFAIKLIPEQLIPAGLMFLLPALVISAFGLPGMLIALGCVILLLFISSKGMPEHGRSHINNESGKSANKFLVFLGLAALVIFFSGFAGLWAFMERLAHDSLEPVVVGQILGLGLVSSALGPLGAAVIGDKWGRVLPISIGSTISIVALCFLIGPITAVKFALLMAFFPAAYYFAIAYIFGIISDTDLSGKYAALIASALALGAGSGPGIFGFLLEKYNEQASYIFSGIMIALGCVVFVWIERRLQATNTSVNSNAALHTQIKT